MKIRKETRSGAMTARELSLLIQVRPGTGYHTHTSRKAFDFFRGDHVVTETQTKMITAIAAYQLVDRGLVKLDSEENWRGFSRNYASCLFWRVTRRTGCQS